jgi:hypothetical protein
VAVTLRNLRISPGEEGDGFRPRGRRFLGVSGPVDERCDPGLWDAGRIRQRRRIRPPPVERRLRPLLPRVFVGGGPDALDRRETHSGSMRWLGIMVRVERRREPLSLRSSAGVDSIDGQPLALGLPGRCDCASLSTRDPPIQPAGGRLGGACAIYHTPQPTGGARRRCSVRKWAGAAFIDWR